jgi:hypothetical protein
MSTKPFICPYCNHGYSRESTLVTHVCEQKRRALAQHDKHVIIAYDAFQRFYRRTMKAERTYEEFAKSPYYNAFVKFGSFVHNVNPLYPSNFIDYVINSGIKLDDWAKDSVYDKYVVDLLKTETVETALTRSINHMISWSEKSKEDWTEYFHKVSIPRFTYDVKDGKISPWILLNAPSGKALLNKLNDEQFTMIATAINPEFWIYKFNHLPADLELARQVIKESKL